MKKIIVMVTFCLVLTGLVSTTFAQPYLACDPMTDEVTQVSVELNGQLITVQAVDIIKRVDVWLLVDLSTINAGSYTAKALAEYGVWGWSESSADFLFVKPVMAAPVNTRLAQ